VEGARVSAPLVSMLLRKEDVEMRTEFDFSPLFRSTVGFANPPYSWRVWIADGGGGSGGRLSSQSAVNQRASMPGPAKVLASPCVSGIGCTPRVARIGPMSKALSSVSR
jgi:hypothetical protein